MRILLPTFAVLILNTDGTAAPVPQPTVAEQLIGRWEDCRGTSEGIEPATFEFRPNGVLVVQPSRQVKGRRPAREEITGKYTFAKGTITLDYRHPADGDPIPLGIGIGIGGAPRPGRPVDRPKTGPVSECTRVWVIESISRTELVVKAGEDRLSFRREPADSGQK